MDRPGSRGAPPGQAAADTKIMRRRDLPVGTAVQAKVGDVVEILGEDRRCPGRAAQAGEDSRGAEAQRPSLFLVVLFITWQL